MRELEDIKKTFIECYESYYESEYYKKTGKGFEEYALSLIRGLRNCSEVLEEVEKEGTGGSFNEATKKLNYVDMGRKTTSANIMHEVAHSNQNFNILPEYFVNFMLRTSIQEGEAIVHETIAKNGRGCNYLLRDEEFKVEFKNFSINGLDYLIFTFLNNILGKEFMERWKKDQNVEKDYIKEMEQIFISKCGKELADKILNLLYSIVCKMNYDLDEKDFNDIKKFYLDTIDVKNRTIEELIITLQYFENFTIKDKDVMNSIYLVNRYLQVIQRYENNREEFVENVEKSKKLIEEVPEMDLIQLIIDFQRTIVETFKLMVYRAMTIEELLVIEEEFLEVAGKFSKIYRKDKDISVDILGIKDIRQLFENKKNILQEEGKCSRLTNNPPLSVGGGEEH